jgi:hypothetical protein
MTQDEFNDKFRGQFRAFIMDCWSIGKESKDKARLADGLIIKLDNLLKEMYQHFNPGTPLESPTAAPAPAAPVKPATPSTPAAPVKPAFTQATPARPNGNGYHINGKN